MPNIVSLANETLSVFAYGSSKMWASRYLDLTSRDSSESGQYVNGGQWP